MDAATSAGSQTPSLPTLPSELIYEIVSNVVADYVDTAIAGIMDDPYNPDIAKVDWVWKQDPRNPVAALLGVSLAVRDITRSALSQALEIPLNEDGRLSISPWSRLKIFRQKYYAIYTLNTKVSDLSSYDIAELGLGPTSLLNAYHILAERTEQIISFFAWTDRGDEEIIAGLSAMVEDLERQLSCLESFESSALFLPLSLRLAKLLWSCRVALSVRENRHRLKRFFGHAHKYSLIKTIEPGSAGAREDGLELVRILKEVRDVFEPREPYYELTRKWGYFHPHDISPILLSAAVRKWHEPMYSLAPYKYLYRFVDPSGFIPLVRDITAKWQPHMLKAAAWDAYAYGKQVMHWMCAPDADD
ncbi:hypothetical protein BXZ70DRAFT_909016 [Cristinia sonorae]|uniref:Uncharacterized protein n=1 Tax=Cristinia sonorae TaxID=1940300 RepID=A0A8K0UJ00_9AGAR|nr:hypothetical protein BXZ70DRAFT_909016 [Cristinia sonorae]